MCKTINLIIRAVLIMSMIFLLAACQAQNQSAKEAVVSGKTLTVVTSFYPVYLSTLNIVKDVPGIRVINLTQPSAGCLHDYQLRPDDLKTLGGAQVFVVNGAGAEAFMDKVVKQLPDLKVIDASQGIPLIKGDGQEGDNPHVWVSISNAIRQVKNIELQMAAIDPANAERYSVNAERYTAQLEALRLKMHQALDGAKHREMITFHEAFPYFAKEFNLNIVAVVEREPGSQPSAAQLSDTIQLVRERNVKALFAEPQYPVKAAEVIAQETGAQVYLLDPVVSGPMEMDAYIKIMESNMKILKEALN